MEAVRLVHRGSRIMSPLIPSILGLAVLGDAASSPAWSSDGTRIAFIREGDETRGLYTMVPNWGDQRLLWSFELSLVLQVCHLPLPLLTDSRGPARHLPADPSLMGQSTYRSIRTSIPPTRLATTL